MKCTNTHKDPRNLTEYTFESVVPEKCCTIRAGENGVTEDLILFLRQMDESEVESNLNYVTGMYRRMRDEEKEKWEKENPDQEYDFCGYTISRDAFLSEEALYGLEEDSTFDAAPSEEESLGSCGIYGLAGMVSPQVERLREIIEELPEKVQILYRLVMLEGEPQKEAAERLGYSPANACQQLRRLKKRIANDAIMRSLFL